MTPRYPDEDHPPGCTDSDTDDDEGDWCYVERRGVTLRRGAGPPVKPGEVSGERWDDEEYDLTNEEEEEDMYNGGGGSGYGGVRGSTIVPPGPMAGGMDAAFERMLGARGKERGVSTAGSSISRQQDAGQWGFRIR